MLLPRRADTILGFKAGCVSSELPGTAKRVFGAILDSFNRETGQCDPSLNRISHLLGVSRRTVIRAVEQLVAMKFLLKSRHGGLSHRNSYQPNWQLFRQLEARWADRKKTKHWQAARPDVSPLKVPESSHSGGGAGGTQT